MNRRNKNLSFFAILSALFIVLLPGASHAVVGDGDHSLWVLLRDIKKDFERDTGIPLKMQPELLVASKGCAKGIGFAFKGKPDREFGLICCTINPATIKKFNIKVYPVAREPLAIIVNRKNRLKNLSQKQIRDIFSGETTSWSRVGGDNKKITVITRLHCRDDKANWTAILPDEARFTGKRMDVLSEPDMAKTVADFTTAIGFLENTSVVDAGGTVKVLAVDGLMPTVENLRSGRYPFFADLAIVTSGDAQGKVVALIEYLRNSPRVREAMKKYGMIQLQG